MRLITHHLHEMQRRVVFVETNRLFAIRNIKFFFTFCETGDRDLVDAESLQRRESGIELAAPTIDENHVRQRLRLTQETPVAAIDRLRHRAEVVCSDNRLDVEDTILILVE